MEYCSLKEAWGLSPNKKIKKLKRRAPESAVRPEEEIQPLVLDEAMVNAYAPTDYSGLLSKDDTEPKIEDRLDQMNDRLDILFEKMTSSSKPAAAIFPDEKMHGGEGSLADTLLFFCMGVLTILLIDTFFKMGMRFRAR